MREKLEILSLVLGVAFVIWKACCYTKESVHEEINGVNDSDE